MPARRARPIQRRTSFWIALAVAAAVVALAAYELEANRQHIGLIALEHALQAKNVDNMPFDPVREAMVIDGDKGIPLLIGYELPTFYERGADGTLTAYTLAEPSDCATAPSESFFAADDPVSGLTVCIARNAASAPANILDVGTADPFTELDGRPFFPTGPTLTFVRNGRRQGTFTAGAVEILPYIPHPVLACTPICSLTLQPERVPLDALSGPTDSRTTDPLPAILGLAPRPTDELTKLAMPRES